MVRRLLILVLLAACTATRPVPLPEDDADRAAAYEAQKRAGTIDVQRAYDVARKQMQTMQTSSPRPFDAWQFLGPGNIGGRTRALVIDPVEPRILYAGGVSGGVWKSETSGATWTPIADDLANIAITTLVMHPTDRATLYAGTGEGFFREEVRGTGLPLRGNGIFVTHDSGATWTQLASTTGEDFYWVNDLVISTHDASVLYAATRTGVWRSGDAGATWSHSLATTVKGGCLELAYRGDQANDILFASCGTLAQSSVHRLRDGVWSQVLSKENMGLTSLAIAPSHPDVMYAMSASNEPGNYNQGLLAVYRSTDGGDTWETRVDRQSPQYFATLMLSNPIAASNHVCDPLQPADQWIGMGWYCKTLAVDPPADENRVWAAGVDAFRSDDGGLTWGVASYWWVNPEAAAFMHADQHAMVFDPRYDGTTNRTMYFTNDGGVFRTDDALATVATNEQAVCFAQSALAFTPINHNYAVTQFYHGAVFPDGLIVIYR